MSEIDYATALRFVDPASPHMHYQLVFRVARPFPARWANAWQSNPTGQLVARVSYPEHPDFGMERYVSRPGIAFLDAEAAVNPGDWPMLDSATINLAEVLRRVAAAGLT